MLKNHLKIALRFFLKNKLFTTINILGLSIGITAFILLTYYVTYEKSYDNYLPRVNDLYRVTLTTNLGEKGFQTSASNHPAIGPAMLEDFPEVESFTRIVDKKLVFSGTFILSYINDQGEKIKSDIRDDHICFATNSIIPTFNIKMRYGNPENALTEPRTIILSSHIAKRFFGNEDPLGKIIRVNDYDDFSFKVSGVFDATPQNTHLPLGMIASYATFPEGSDYSKSWVWPEFYTYVKLKPGTDPKLVESRFPHFVKKYLGDIMAEHGFEARFGLQPVRDIHIKSNFSNEISTNNNEATLYFLIIVASFIIGIALINYINLSTAKSMERAKEVGIKKVVGANRSTLIKQFLFESLLINFFAMLLAILLITIFMPSFNVLTGTPVLSMALWSKVGVWSTLLGIFIFGGLLAGLYPAFVLSGFIPVKVLKGSFQSTEKGLILRKTLVVAQFAISIALVAGTYIVYSQFSYMQNQYLGFNADHNLTVNAPSYIDSLTPGRVETFKRELLQDPNIKSVTLSNEIPGKRITERSSIRKSMEGKEEGVSNGLIHIDEDYFSTLSITFLAGRNFTKDDATHYYDDNGPVGKGHRVIINKSAVKALGFSDTNSILDEKITFKYGPIERTAKVIGVVKDYHQESLRQAYEPIVFMNSKDYFNVDYLTIKLSGELKTVLGRVEEKFESFFPNDVYKSFFVDDYFNQQYKAEVQFGKVCLWFSILAIFIAALGLFGLGSHIAIQKTKEISVRKVLGATMGQALLIIPQKLLGLVLLSGTVALPLIYFITNQWLNGYAFRIKMNLWMFLIPLLMVVLMAIMSIMLQSLRAANINPADALRNE